MQKQLADYAQYYIGCEVQTKIRRETSSMQPMKKLKGKLMEVDLFKNDFGILLEDETDKSHYHYLDDIKLILRPLSSMTEEEKIELFNISNCHFDFSNDFDSWTPNEFIFLLSKNFDIFNLESAGVAVYEEDLKPAKSAHVPIINPCSSCGKEGGIYTGKLCMECLPF